MSQEQYTCEYCDKILVNRSSLNKHKSSNNCLKIQGKQTNELKHKCNCGYSTNRKDNFERHQRKCNEEQKQTKEKNIENNNTDQNNIIEQPQSKPSSYEQKISKYLEPLNNEFIDNLKKYIDDKLKEKITRNENCKQEDLADIIKEFGNFSEFYITDNKAGEYFYWKDANNRISADNKACSLLDILKDIIKIYVKEINNNENNFNNDLYDLQYIYNSSKRFRKRLAEHVYISKSMIKSSISINNFNMSELDMKNK